MCHTCARPWLCFEFLFNLYERPNACKRLLILWHRLTNERIHINATDIGLLTSGDTVKAGAPWRALYSLCQHKQSKMKSLSCKTGFGDSSPLFISRFEDTWKKLSKDNFNKNEKSLFLRGLSLTSIFLSYHPLSTWKTFIKVLCSVQWESKRRRRR